MNRAEVGGENADPGNLELDWFEVQLGLFRSRDMKVCPIAYCVSRGADVLRGYHYWTCAALGVELLPRMREWTRWIDVKVY